MESQKMESQKKEKWQVLCEQAATEKDPDRLMTLIKEISRILDDKLRQRDQPNAA